MHWDLDAREMAEVLPSLLCSSWVSPDPPGLIVPRGGCSCSASPTTPKEPQAGGTWMGCNHDPALLCFADYLFCGTHKYIPLSKLSLLYQ